MEDLEEWKLVALREKRETIMKEIHDEATAGHPCIDKSYKRAAYIYYWPGIYRSPLRKLAHLFTPRRVACITILRED